MSSFKKSKLFFPLVLSCFYYYSTAVLTEANSEKQVIMKNMELLQLQPQLEQEQSRATLSVI